MRSSSGVRVPRPLSRQYLLLVYCRAYLSCVFLHLSIFFHRLHLHLHHLHPPRFLEGPILDQRPM